MQKFLFFFLVIASLASAPARAEEFYVELGRATTETEAKSLWEGLQKQYPKILRRYGFFPNQILRPDGSFTYRVQAGPMKDKRESERVCRRLFRFQVSCFVIEGFDPNNAKTFDAKPAAADAPEPVVSTWDFLPWNQSSKPVPPAPAVKEEAKPAMAAPVEEKKEVVAEPRKPAKKLAEAKVDVAEAIAVPVSDFGNEVTVGDAPAIMVADSPALEAQAAVEPAAVSGWLSIQPFLDEERAQSFWTGLKKSAVRGLSQKIIHPLVSHDIPKVILAVGEFESEEKAMKFCRDYVDRSDYLECQFSSQPPQAREEGESRGLLDRVFGSSAAEGESYSLYWAEVLAEKSQDKALEKWERIRTDNDDLLVDVRSQITTSVAQPGVYVVRIGPLKTKEKAEELCGALGKRKVACKTVSL